MRARVNAAANCRGFTLLEIIMTLVVAAILGTILVQYMSTGLTRSTGPITQVQKTYSLNQIIEFMTADYKNLLKTDSDPLATLQTHIQAGNDSANDPYFGEYSQQTGYIKFPGAGGSEMADATGDNTVLKVVISSGGQSLTALFTK